MNRTLPLVALLLGCGPLAAQNGGIDRRFGDDGIASIGNQQEANAYLVGIVSCATSSDQALLVSLASAPPGLATLRIDARGRPVGTLNRIPLPAADPIMIGACAAEGRVVIARSISGAGTDTNLQVVRLTNDGQLDATFGGGTGAVVVDMDAFATLGDFEKPVGLNVEPDGGVLVSLSLTTTAGDPDAGILRLGPSGAPRFARHLPTLPGVAATRAASAAGVAPDGGVWLVGTTQGPGVDRWFRASLDPTTGATRGALVGDGAEDIVTGGGRMLSDGRMVVAMRFAADGTRYLPRLLVFRGDVASQVDLPPPFDVSGSPGALPYYIGYGAAIPTGDDRILVVNPLSRVPNVLDDIGTYLAAVELGATAAQDRVDLRFGINGRSQFAWRGAAACPEGIPPTQRPVHVTNWRGRPLLTGWHTTTCAGTSPRAMLARILDGEDVFAHDFE